MHDLDRALFESERTDGETASAEREEFLELLGELVQAEGGRGPEWGGAATSGSGGGGDRVAREIAMASELLEVQTEAELEQFLGGLVRKAAGAVGDVAGSGAGRALRGVLKRAAGRALPAVGHAVGRRWGSSARDLGERVGRSAGSLLGLELEGLSREDREFEVARAFVRFADAAAREVAAAPSFLPAADVAKSAVTSAAQQHLPGLLPSVSSGAEASQGGGRWVRHDDRIVIHGA